MRRFVPVTTFAIAAIMVAAPSGLATWSAYGSYEPDTILDVPAYAWPDAPVGPSSRIYFNAWASIFGLVNPNLAALGSSTEVPTLESHAAIFGVWTDCNGDGYVGHVESAVYEYKSELLLDDSVCPAVTGSGNTWTQGAHNYNGWVSELIVIAGCDFDATADVCSDGVRDQRVYKDVDAMVWGDYGRPDDFTADSGAGTCALTPFPRGTWSHTGGLINYADCGTGLMGAWNGAMETAGDPAGLTFPDENDATGSFADMETFGSEDSNEAAVYVADCDADPVVRVGDVLNDSGLGGPTADETGGGQIHDINVPTLDPRTGDTASPTLPGQYNQTSEELQGDCDTSNDRGADFYGGLLGEGDFNSNPVVGKHESDWNFGFNFVNRGEAPWNVVGQSSGNAGAPSYLGLSPLSTFSGWSSPSTLIKTTGPNTVRGINTDDPTASDPGIAGGYWLTFYASVSPSTVARFSTPGGIGTYGLAQCAPGDDSINEASGWDCDEDRWNLNPDGTELPLRELLAVPGDLYQFRDVDCYDGRVAPPDAGAEAGVGLPYYGDEPCLRP